VSQIAFELKEQAGSGAEIGVPAIANDAPISRWFTFSETLQKPVGNSTQLQVAVMVFRAFWQIRIDSCFRRRQRSPYENL
jgi:hypothetical protein